jgi:NAD(P)H dehydrogenase (quinone)
MPKVLVTGATGHLGRQTIEFLTRRIPNDQIVALARDPSALSDLLASSANMRRFEMSRRCH